jgi:NTE family protein
MNKKSVSLVLGSGGARGLAHIGVIESLNRHSYEIHDIAGSSIGALVGGIYAAGELDTYTRWVSALERRDVIQLLDFSFRRSGLLKGERIIAILKDLIGNRNIEELPIAFTAVATDIYEQKEVWMNRGPLFDALRASIAIPTIFTPHNYLGRRLLDGGLINPIPIAPTLAHHTDITIAVNLSAKPEPGFTTRRYRESGPGYRADYSRRIGQFIETLPWVQGWRESNDMGFFDVVAKSMDTMQNTIARFKLATHTPDVIIEIPRNVCTFFEFHRARELIETGRQRADEVLGKIAEY